MIHCDAAACPAKSARSSYFLVVETQEIGRPGMRYCDSIFGHLLKPISRQWFAGVVARHEADAYDKEFRSWDHLTLLIFAQLSGVGSLRGLEAAWNANAHHHYHLGAGEISRSTVSDANARRPLAVFTETFAMLSGLAGRRSKREGEALLSLIDSSPIPLGKLYDWAKWNGRIRGLKLHTVYEPACDNPTHIEITDANINDMEIGEKFPIKPGFTHVFDKGYCKYPWWTAIHEAGATFVTRQKTSSRFRATCWRKLKKRRGDGFRIVDDAEVKLVSKGDSRLPIPMRRIRVRRDDGAKITLVTNDMERSAVEIAGFYKTRWQIELLFRWIKQHLHVRSFLGRNANAISLQLVAAMIAFILLRLAARENLVKIPIIRFAGLVTARLFMRTAIAHIDKPPEVHPSRAMPKHSPNQMEFRYA
jgi:IS4 transposase